jgi:hypothetical protein
VTCINDCRKLQYRFEFLSLRAEVAMSNTTRVVEVVSAHKHFFQVVKFSNWLDIILLYAA